MWIINNIGKNSFPKIQGVPRVGDKNKTPSAVVYFLHNELNVSHPTSLC